MQFKQRNKKADPINMKLREEIRFILKSYPPHTQEDGLIHIFKKWVLEMVGEDEENLDLDEYVPGKNAVRKQIRKRIEESTKC